MEFVSVGFFAHVDIIKYWKTLFFFYFECTQITSAFVLSEWRHLKTVGSHLKQKQYATVFSNIAFYSLFYLFSIIVC